MSGGRHTHDMGSIAYAQEVPVVHEGDVLVIGGGPAGIGAAVGAARAGARTALVERYGFLGGSATAALVGPFMTSFSDDGQTQIIRGVFDELVRRMEAVGGAIHPSKVRKGTSYSSFIVGGHDHVTPFHAEALKLVSAEMLLEAGVKLFLHSSFVDVISHGNALVGAIVLTKAGLRAIRATVTIDCTGDADVAFKAGALTMKGRSADGKMQPLSMFLRVGNVNLEKVKAYHREHPGERRIFGTLIKEHAARGEFTIPRAHILVFQEPDGWAWRINCTRLLGLDATDPDDLTTAEIEGRRQVAFLMDFLRKHVPGFENCVLIEAGAQAGVRETRRIVGEYVLQVTDLAAEKPFPDTIALSSYPVDIHQVDGSFGGVTDEYRTANAYSIPYRSLVPLQVDGLLAAGRCLSATHEAAGAVRTMPAVCAMGHAAGVAAALAARHRVPPRHIEVRELQAQLLDQDAVLNIGTT